MSVLRKIAALAGYGLLGCAVVVMTAWASLAVYYSDLVNETTRLVLAALIPVAALASFIFLPRRRRTLFCFCLVFLLVVAWWAAIRPSNQRDWQADVAVLPYAEITGNHVKIRHIRNFTYRTETDYDIRYYDKVFDLDKLDSVDLIAVYWMGDAIAHVMLSFGFAGQDYVVFSIEVRKEKGEGYSSIKGFFKQFELTYIVADERDVIRLRTDFRNPREDVYLYRMRMGPEDTRRLFMEYVNKINALKENPEFYNTLTTNCTTNVVRHIRAFGMNVRYTWKILLSGYAARYAYDLGGLDTRLPYEELRRRSYINPRAHAVGDDPAFSRKIREGLPVPLRDGERKRWD